MNPDKKFYWELPCSKGIDNRKINTVPVSGEKKIGRPGDRGLQGIEITIHRLISEAYSDHLTIWCVGEALLIESIAFHMQSKCPTAEHFPQPGEYFSSELDAWLEQFYVVE